MSITKLDDWLKGAGYEYHCFVSYPRIKNDDGSIDEGHAINQCALQVKRALVSQLKASIPEPKVFLDRDMGGGADWERKMERALCRSVVMVAICADIYYHPSHPWCGREWAAMDSLGGRRLRGSGLRAIVPLMFKAGKSVPDVVRAPNWSDVSGASASRRYYSTRAFNNCINEVVTHIERVAEVIAERQALSRCKRFSLPAESAFAEWQAERPGFPLTGGRRPCEPGGRR